MTIEMIDIVLILLAVLFSALFSGIETAFLSTSRLKIELKNAQNDSAGILLSGFVKQTPRVLSTILVGNTLALILYGIAIGNVLGELLEFWGWIDPHRQPYLALALETGFATLLILYVGEFLPKAFFRLRAEQIMFQQVTTRSLQGFMWLFWPHSAHPIQGRRARIQQRRPQPIPPAKLEYHARRRGPARDR
jgi:CBS domain containing-hemolysin-like protein